MLWYGLVTKVIRFVYSKLVKADIYRTDKVIAAIHDSHKPCREAMALPKGRHRNTTVPF